MRHRLRLLLLLVAALGLVVFVLLPAGIRFAAGRGLSALGFGANHGGAVSLGLRATRIDGIAVGRNGTVSLQATYSADGLLSGRLDTIAVTDARLHGALGPDGALRVDGYTATPTSATPSAITLPAARILIQSLDLALDTPAGAVDLSGAGAIVPVDGELRLSAALTLGGGRITGTAAAEATLSAAGWTLSLDPIHLILPAAPAVANTIDGHLALRQPPGGAIVGSGHLGGDQLVLESIPLGRFNADFAADAESQTASIALAPADRGAGLDARLKRDANGTTGTLKARIGDIAPLARLFSWGAMQGAVRADLAITATGTANPRPAVLTLDYDGAAPSGASLRNAKLQLSGAYDSRQGALVLTSCGKFSADAATFGGLALAGLSGCLGPAPDRPLFRQDPSGDLSLAATAMAIAAAIPSGEGTLARLSLASAEASVDVAAGKIARLDAKAAGGAADFPDLGAGFRDLVVTSAHVAADGSVSGTLAASFGPTGRLAPRLPISGSLGGNVSDGPSMALIAGSPASPPVIRLSLAGHAAHAEMKPTVFGAGAADLVALIPGVAPTIAKLSGTLGLRLDSDWSGPKPDNHGLITLENVDATTPNFTVEGVNAAITLTRLAPLATADHQTLSLKSLSAGVKLTDGAFTFGIDSRNVLDIAEGHLSLAGGTVSTRDQQLDLYGPDQHFGLVVRDVDLAQLLSLLDVKGLSAEGTLDGVIPLRHIKNTILVEHGVLQTLKPGILRYDPADSPSFLQGQSGEGISMLREALKDFRYERLGMAIDGVLGGEEQIKVQLKGANPKLYGGLPIALNVNLSGALDSIARSSIETYTHPERAAGKQRQNTQGKGN